MAAPVVQFTVQYEPGTHYTVVDTPTDGLQLVETMNTAKPRWTAEEVAVLELKVKNMIAPSGSVRMKTLDDVVHEIMMSGDLPDRLSGGIKHKLVQVLVQEMQVVNHNLQIAEDKLEEVDEFYFDGSQGFLVQAQSDYKD